MPSDFINPNSAPGGGGPTTQYTQRSNLSATKRLCRSVQYGYQRMQPMRDSRYRFLSQYVGPFYSRSKGELGTDEKKASPVNLMWQAVTTLVPNLVSRDPQVQIGSEILAYREYGQMLGLATNTVARRIRLAHTLRKTVTDSLFGPGFIKSGIAVSGQTLDLENNIFDIGAPYADRVDPDDMILDPGAREWEEQLFVGNRFRVPKLDLLESGLYDNGKIERLCSRYDAGQFRKEASSLAGDANVLQAYNELAEFVDLCEIFLPRQGVIITLPFGKDYETDEPLRIVQYEGPERGPYHMLGFAFVPDNILPVAPASIWYWLQVMSNTIARKIKRQAERMKTVLAYEPTAEEDAKEIEDADDGETVAVENVNALKEINFGGASDDAYKYMAWVEAQFSKNAGNIDMLAGTQTNEDTLGQSEILQNNGQVRVADMKGIVNEFAGEVLTDIAFMIHTDPLIETPLVRRVNGVEQQVIYTPEMREGDFFDYWLRVRPYSMAPTDPSQRSRKIMEFISSALPAIASTAMAFGPGFNVEGAIRVAADAAGVEEVDELVNSGLIQQHLMMMMQQGPQPDGKLGAMMGQQQPPALPGGARPEQPNPRATGPTGGVSPETEKNQQYQERSADVQAARFA